MSAHKVMLLGEIGVGKSSLARRLVHDRFDTDYRPTLGVDIYRYDVPDPPGDAPVSLVLWDTDGNFGDAIFSHAYMKQAAAAVIVADVTRPATIEAMERLSAAFRLAFPGRYEALVLNKIDLLGTDSPPLPAHLGQSRDNQSRDRQSRDRQSRDNVFHTSAKTGENVRHAFQEAAAAIVRRGL